MNGARSPGRAPSHLVPPTEFAGHHFADPALLRRALTHRSAGLGLASNERLEFLGDRVLGLLVAEWLNERYPTESEGDLGKRLARLVARPLLAEVAGRIGLAAALNVPASESRAGVRLSHTVLADAVEAVIAALYLDGGLDAARDFVRREFGFAMEAMTLPPMAAKTRLQEWLLSRGLGLPRYRVVGSSGPPHAPRFVVAAEAQGMAAEAEASTKRAAEEEAALKLLALLEGSA
jgi:ribonuclease-3